MASSGSAISKTTHKVLTGGGSKGIQDAQEAKTNPKPTHLPNTPIRMEARSSYATSVQSIKLGDGAVKFNNIIFNNSTPKTIRPVSRSDRKDPTMSAPSAPVTIKVNNNGRPVTKNGATSALTWGACTALMGTAALYAVPSLSLALPSGGTTTIGLVPAGGYGLAAMMCYAGVYLTPSVSSPSFSGAPQPGQ